MVLSQLKMSRRRRGARRTAHKTVVAIGREGIDEGGVSRWSVGTSGGGPSKIQAIGKLGEETKQEGGACAEHVKRGAGVYRR